MTSSKGIYLRRRRLHNRLTLTYPMSAKHPASSPLSSEFDKKSRLGLTDEELEELNNELNTIIDEHFPKVAELSAEDVPTSALVLACRTASLYLLGTGCASTIDKFWLNPESGGGRIKQLSRNAQLDFTSIWIEARAKGDWERFANHRALGPSDRSPYTYVDAISCRLT